MPDRPITAPRRRPLVVFAGALALGLAVARCGAENVDAPPLPKELEPPPSQCKSLEGYMPEFFELLRDPAEPLRGLRLAVEAITKAPPGTVQGDPLAAVLANSVRGLKQFTNDPPEDPLMHDGCWPASDQNPLPADWELCGIEGRGAPCENRMCSLKRALDFSIRDRAAQEALLALRPLLVKLLGYMTNTGDGADGREHYEAIGVLHKTSSAEFEGICSPKNLLVVLDGVVTYFRNDAACSRDESCVGLQAMANLEGLLKDPALTDFLSKFEASESDGKGRQSFQKLGSVLGQALAEMPDDETYFDQVQNIVDTVVVPFFDRDPDRYGAMKQRTLSTIALTKGLLNPHRDGAFLKELKGVIRCVNRVDEQGELVGAVYDLLSRPAAQGGLDLKDLVKAIGDVGRLDDEGVLMGAIHTVLATIGEDEQGLDAVRELLEHTLSIETARQSMPVLKTMVDRGVLDELLDVLDNLLFGCKGTST